jgi:hypothetical protein
MNVGELCALLLTYPSDRLVVASKDSEGNEFSPVSEVSVGKYEADTTWSGEFISYVEDETRRRTVSESNALCIWPTN